MSLIDTMLGNAEDAHKNERQEYLAILRRNDRPQANDAQRLQQIMGILGLSLAMVQADAERVGRMEALKAASAKRPQVLSAYEAESAKERLNVGKQRAIIEAANEAIRQAGVERWRLESELSAISAAETELGNLEKRYPHLA
jgi:hypothetical protein